MKASLFKLSLITLALTALTGCDEKNQLPVVYANAPESIDERSQVSLSVTARDADGSIATYHWLQEKGPEVNFTASGNSIEFTVPDVSEDTALGFTVTVVDNEGASASTDLSTIIKQINLAPIFETANPPNTIDERVEASLSIVATDIDGSIDNYAWKQLAGPDLEFTQQDGIINFTAPDVSEDTALVFEVTAEDNEGESATTELTTQIKHINRAPIVEDLQLDVEFNASLQFTLSASDPDGDTLTASFSDQQSIGELKLIDASAQQYQYTSANDNIVPDSVNIILSDGVDTTTAVIGLNIIDSSAPSVVSVTPEADSERVAVDTQVFIEFDDVMSVVADVANNTCLGPIQMSFDNFQTCSAFSVTSANPKQFTLTPSTLEFDKTYQIKVSANATNFHGVAATESIVSTFKTANGDLQITELSSSKYWSDNRWLEIFNGTNKEINLADYTIHTASVDLDTYSESGLQVFPLPDKIIAAGTYMIVQGRFGNGFWQSSVEESSQLVLIGNSSDNIRPYWGESGFIELLNQDETKTIDFIRFGHDLQVPVSAEQWNTTTSGPLVEEQLGMSLVRAMDASDTNTSNDWRAAQFMTPGGQNDINCIDDLDADGIPDCAEQEGATFAGLPLYEWGARSGIKDIFIEVDYMQSNDPGITPHQEALQRVIDVFAQQDYAVHFDVGDLYHQAAGTSPAHFDLGGGNEVEFYLQTLFTSSATAPGIIDHKVKHSDIRRRPIFHYMLMANTQQKDGSGGSSGYAEINGNDLFISLGNWGLSMDTEDSRNMTINFQSSTIFHELGHNVGLLHGGDDYINNKPNHLSSMNYLYQLDGLPTIGQREGDRYYKRFFFDNLNCNSENNELFNGFTVSPQDFGINYSSGTSANIDENAVNESLGFGQPNAAAVDFNCNGIIDNNLVNYDVDFNGVNSDLLRDVDEWAMVNLQFTQYWSGNVSGAEQSLRSDKPSQNVMNDDRQTTIKEDQPSQAFFQKIQMINND
ncbi:Ig-like domain-containing protein [Shewanella gelidimarina]|uniref:PKD domain-containing protein n=1 Tax=Shewanella gelidimarina TaxID=56813 RepID=UPI002010C557|nr:Ig-like domain-containing protein [Shewanella gelidimarina]MCL1058956.1 Ig-like domain-containing protein [Shewanella gelidimarina]